MDPLCFFFARILSLAQSGTAVWSEASETRGTRKTQLEWRSCSAELEATVGGNDKNPRKLLVSVQVAAIMKEKKLRC